MSLAKLTLWPLSQSKAVSRPVATQILRHYATAKSTPATRNHPPRRTYLYEQYESIVKDDRVMFIFQHNNLNVQEFTQIRRDLKGLGGPVKLTVIRSEIFNAVLRNTKYANLEPLVTGGPACVLHSNVNDAEHPDLLKNAIQVLNKNKKLMLLGGKIDDLLLSEADVQKVVELPGLPQLQAELLGVLEAPARKLISLLSSPAQQLHSVLDRRTE